MRIANKLQVNMEKISVNSVQIGAQIAYLLLLNFGVYFHTMHSRLTEGGMRLQNMF